MRSEQEVRERYQALCDVEANGPHTDSRTASIRRAKIRDLRWVLKEAESDA